MLKPSSLGLRKQQIYTFYARLLAAFVTENKGRYVRWPSALMTHKDIFPGSSSTPLTAPLSLEVTA